MKQLADLSFRDGELAIRVKQVEGRVTSVEALLPLAERTTEEIQRSVKKLDAAVDRNIVSSITRNDTLRGSLDAATRFADLQVQLQTTGAELDVLNEARSASKAALTQLNRLYDDGYLRAPAPGVVGAKVPLVGQVVQPGVEMMQVYGGKAYLLAYLPDQYLFGIKDGMPVKVSGGGNTVRGEIDSILAVADALPAEFQNMYRPRDRSRLVRILLPDNQPFAASQKVTVTGCAFGLCWVK